MGISEEDSSIYLNEINKLERKGAFALTFSYSRALQSSCIKIWGGKEENFKAAQDQLYARAKANSEASVGKYVPGSQPSIEESLSSRTTCIRHGGLIRTRDAWRGWSPLRGSR